MNKALENITTRISRGGDIEDPATPVPLLTLEEFFIGNEHVGSICCNLDPIPLPSEVYSVLKAIRQDPKVLDVLVGITMFDDPEWPFSDTVWVIAAANEEEIMALFPEALRPDACFAGWTEGVTFEPYLVPAGKQPIACWWD